MTEFIHKVTKEDEGMEVREIMRTYFDFSARLRNKIKREKLVMLNDEQTPGLDQARSRRRDPHRSSGRKKPFRTAADPTGSSI